MAGQAGWYRAPGEEGLLRYWNGVTWTDHRQPDPAALRAPETVTPVEPEPDPMAEYERQFDTPSPNEPAADAPLYRPRATPAPSAFASAPAPEFAGHATTSPLSFSLGVIGLGPVAPTQIQASAAPESEFDRVFAEVTAIAQKPAAPASEVEPGRAGQDVAQEPSTGQTAIEQVPPPAGSAGRKAVLGAVRIMGAAVLVILLGIAAMVFFSLQSSVGPGEAQTNAIVTSLGAASSTSCTPVARFAVAGKSYTASSTASISPCPIGLGESVSVVYSAADPAAAARIEIGSSLTSYLWLVPILGGVVFLGGVIAFIVRAGSMLAGIALLRQGRTRTTKPDSVA